jgi:hypothetical protein
MFGGLCFLVSDSMCCGIVGDSLMAGVGSVWHRECLEQQRITGMDFTIGPMKGFVYVHPEGIAEDAGLSDEVDKCLRFVLSLPKIEKAGSFTRIRFHTGCTEESC